jgi:hypothetical protein
MMCSRSIQVWNPDADRLNIILLTLLFSEVVLFRIERKNDMRALLRKCAILITTERDKEP